MAVPQVNTPAYIIYRDVPLGEVYDATSPLSFFPAKGSDELFDALRETFPHLKTHSERMRDAIIQFLLEERQGEQFEFSPATTMESSQLTWPSVSSGSTSNFSSPDLLNFATPASFSDSPQIQQTSTATSSQPSPPSLDQMTGVFSLSSNPQPKQRVRRKMTEAEKIEYRKRRIVKACDKCAKRKRKCPHNQAEMRTAPTSTKSTSPLSASATVPTERQTEPQLPMLDEGFDPTTFGSFGDFNMYDDPLPEVSVDDFFHFDQFEDTSPLFNNMHHANFGSVQPPRQDGALVQNLRDQGNGVPSRLINSQNGLESQIHSTSDQSYALPDLRDHVQMHPSQQRAVRDPRTGGSLSQASSSSDQLERQSGRMIDVHASEILRISSQSTHDPGRGLDSDTGSNRYTANIPLSESSYPTDIPRQRARPPRSSSQQESASTTSTSVSPLSESSDSRTATLQQGRPQPTRLQNNLASSEQGEQRQRSLGEGIRLDNSLATELFMLRRRLPKTQNRQTASRASRPVEAGIANAAIQLNTRGQQCPDQLSAQANGGAYLQLGKSESIAPTHTSRRTYRGGRAEVQEAASSQNAPLLVQQDRLSDHVRFKDHNGEYAALPQILLAIAASMLLAFLSPSVFLLGLAILLATQAGTDSKGIVKCTTKNSSWLSSSFADLQKSSDIDIGLLDLKSRQFLRGSGSSQFGENFFGMGSGAWLMGLMYPFKLAPLAFAVV